MNTRSCDAASQSTVTSGVIDTITHGRDRGGLTTTTTTSPPEHHATAAGFYPDSTQPASLSLCAR
jgi:hypothetical protein